jgi:hypothetical protein
MLYNINKNRGEKNTHHQNWFRSASKLKRGVIEGTGGLFWLSLIVDFSSPICFCWFLCAENRDRESLSVKFILHSSWYTDMPLVSVFVNLFFFQCDLLCLFLVGFFLSTRCCQYYIMYIGHINCWQNRPEEFRCRTFEQIDRMFAQFF